MIRSSFVTAAIEMAKNDKKKSNVAQQGKDPATGSLPFNVPNWKLNFIPWPFSHFSGFFRIFQDFGIFQDSFPFPSLRIFQFQFNNLRFSGIFQDLRIFQDFFRIFRDCFPFPSELIFSLSFFCCWNWLNLRISRIENRKGFSRILRDSFGMLGGGGICLLIIRRIYSCGALEIDSKSCSFFGDRLRILYDPYGILMDSLRIPAGCSLLLANRLNCKWIRIDSRSWQQRRSIASLWQLLWNCSETALKLLWNCSENARKWHWNSSKILEKIALKLL